MLDNVVYTKMDKIGTYNNKIKSSLFYLFLEIYLEEKRWIHANPTLYAAGKYKDVYKRYYIEDSSQMERFYNKLIEKDPFFIILRGKRGSGKTSFLNYFFNLKTRELNNYKPLPLTWVRIDTTKLYKTIISYRDKIGFLEYLHTQILFVYLRYMGENDKKGQKECRTHMHYENGLSFDVDSCDKVFANINIEEEIKKEENVNFEYYEQLKKQYTIAYKEAKNTSNFNDSTKGKCFQCQELGRFLYKKIHKQLIVVIDGIDNINYNSNIKHKVWEDLITFLENIQKEEELRPHKLVIALRDENHELLKEKLPTFSLEGVAHGTGVDIFTIEAPKLTTVMKKFKNNLLDNKENDIEFYTKKDYNNFLRNFLLNYQKIFMKKIDSIRGDKNIDENFYHKMLRFTATNISKLDDENLNKLVDENFYLFDSAISHTFKHNGYEFIEELKKALRYLMENDKHNEIGNFFIYVDYFLDAYKNVFELRTQHKLESTVLDSLFNGDYREQFIQSYKSYIFLMDYAKSDHEKRNFTSMKDYALGRDLIITQSLFSNGNKYQTDKYDIRFYPPYRNINTINLLNILDKNRQEISPLVTIYLLIFLVKQEVTLTQLLDIFTDENISKTYIDKVLQELLEFGYIQVSYNNHGEETLYYKATEKGKHLINFSFNDIDAIQAYIYGGLHPSRYTPYYRVYTEKNYASEILFNMLLFWHEIQEQEEALLPLKNSLKIDSGMVTSSAKDAYKKLLEGSFPEHYIYSDIEKYIPNDKELQDVLKEMHRHVMFEKKSFDILYENEYIHQQLLEILSQEERILYLSIYIVKEGLSEDEIEEKLLRDLYYHKFIFDDIDDTKMKERKSIIFDVVNSKYYWNIRYDMIRKLDFIKKKFNV